MTTKKDLLARESWEWFGKRARDPNVWKRATEWSKIRIKASAVGSCTNEMVLALQPWFVCLALPPNPIRFAALYIFMLILTMGNTKGNDALPAECQQIYMSKEHCCDDEHFPLEQDFSYWLWQWIMSFIPTAQIICLLVDLFSHSPYN